MNQERLMKIIVEPYVSEKGTILSEKHRQFVFKVLTNATKLEVKKAVELLFNVQVDSVGTCIVKGKRKVFKQIPGRRKNWKKAYVALKEGNDINFADIK